MFSISFGEMMVILIMGLLVIGPKRLPAAALFIGHLFGRVQRQVSSIKSDIRREMDLAELREMQASYKEAAQNFSKSMNDQVAGPAIGKDKEDKPAPAPEERPADSPLAKAPAQSP